MKAESLNSYIGAGSNTTDGSTEFCPSLLTFERIFAKQKSLLGGTPDRNSSETGMLPLNEPRLDALTDGLYGSVASHDSE